MDVSSESKQWKEELHLHTQQVRTSNQSEVQIVVHKRHRDTRTKLLLEDGEMQEEGSDVGKTTISTSGSMQKQPFMTVDIGAQTLTCD